MGAPAARPAASRLLGGAGSLPVARDRLLLLRPSPRLVQRVQRTIARAPDPEQGLRDGLLSVSEAEWLLRVAPGQRSKVLDAVERGDCKDVGQAVCRHAASLPVPGGSR